MSTWFCELKVIMTSRIFEHEELMDYNDYMPKSGDVSSARAFEDDFM